ncbi:hypothetical protein F7725_024476 [Dissostichus mawsoni]|uniref:Family with sequence similarity 98 member A n=1 Tax=Dissostichus mawsoni TaxID=36200 RepID=A0A7J5XZE7_DISMA|nr:hypothetical protein F7725_024476 [Dissostichus mawsoni]
MENDTLVSLEDLGYQGPLLEDGALDGALSGGAASPEFTKLCAWISTELRLYCQLEENVHATNCPSEAEAFQLEMSGLLSELASFLVSELEASRMILVNKPEKKSQESGSPMFLELKGICMALGMSKPPANITMFQFFSGIEKKLKEAMSKVPPHHVGEPLMKKALGPVHVEKIEAINQALVNEYEMRRKMLLKRLDVTVQSFGWSDRAKTHAEKLASVYQPLRSALCTKSNISVAHLLAARQDFSKILRTSSGKIREKTACAINKSQTGGAAPVRSRLLPQRCPPGRSVRMPPKAEDNTVGVGMEGRGVYDQYSQGGRGGYERGGGRGGGGGSRGGRCREAGEGGGGGRGSYNQGHYQDAGGHQGGGGRGGYGGGGNNQAGFQDSAFHGGGGGGHHDNNHQERGGGRGGRGGRGRGGRGAGAGGGGGVGGGVGAGAAGGAGGGGQGGGWGGEGGRILIKEDSLNSSSNKAGSTTTKLALLKADNTPVEEEWGASQQSPLRDPLLVM